MHNCIFSAHCTESYCDRSCPILAETSYLLERNNIGMSSQVFAESAANIDKCCKLLSDVKGFVVYKCDDTVKWAELLTYCAICQNWKGSQLHCAVYHLKYSKYLDKLKESWSSNETTDLDYIKIWSQTSKILIISNLDYVNFGDFESQTILNLIQERNSAGLTTLLIAPPSGLITKSSASMLSVMLKKQIDDHIYRPDRSGGGTA